MGLAAVKGSRLRRRCAPWTAAATPWRETGMLRIQTDILEFNRRLQPLVRAIARHDSGLADQLRRAARSVYLNSAEAFSHRAGNRRNRLDIALGEAREARAALALADALGYVRLDPSLDGLADKICATLYKLGRRRASA